MIYIYIYIMLYPIYNESGDLKIFVDLKLPQSMGSARNVFTVWDKEATGYKMSILIR